MLSSELYQLTPEFQRNIIKFLFIHSLTSCTTQKMIILDIPLLKWNSEKQSKDIQTISYLDEWIN